LLLQATALEHALAEAALACGEAEAKKKKKEGEQKNE